MTSHLEEARSAGEASAGTSAAELAALRNAQADLQARLTAAEEAAASAAGEVAEQRRQSEDAASAVEAVRAELRATTQRLQARSDVASAPSMRTLQKHNCRLPAPTIALQMAWNLSL